jgi:hypothetical protein
MTTKNQVQRQKQIPSGDDNQKDNAKSNGNGNGGFFGC